MSNCFTKFCRLLLLIGIFLVVIVGCKKRKITTIDDFRKTYSENANPSQPILLGKQVVIDKTEARNLAAIIKIQTIQGNNQFPLHGSGFFYRGDGYFLTNYHIAQYCIEKADVVENGFKAKSKKETIPCPNFRVNIPQLETEASKEKKRLVLKSVHYQKAAKVSLVAVPKFTDICIKESAALSKVSAATKESLLKACSQSNVWPHNPKDFAILHVELPKPNSFIPLSNQTPVVGEKITITGYPGLYCGDEAYSPDEILNPNVNPLIKERLDKAISDITPKYRDEKEIEGTMTLYQKEVEIIVLTKALELFTDKKGVLSDKEFFEPLRNFARTAFPASKSEIATIDNFYFINNTLYTNLLQQLTAAQPILTAYLKSLLNNSNTTRIKELLEKEADPNRSQVNNALINILIGNFNVGLSGGKIGSGYALTQNQFTDLNSNFKRVNAAAQIFLPKLLKQYQTKLASLVKTDLSMLDSTHCYGRLSKFEGTIIDNTAYTTVSSTARTLPGTSGGPVTGANYEAFAIHFSVTNFSVEQGSEQVDIIQSNEIKTDVLKEYWRGKWFWQ